METPKTEDETLQMLFDGELAPDQEAELRRDLQGSAEGMTQLREWEQLRRAMKTVSSGWAGQIDSDALFARIEAEVDASELPLEQHKRERPALRVVPGGRERRVWGAVATGFAAAAVIFLAVMAWPESQQGPGELAGAGTRARGSEVLEVDFGSNTGTIFEVEGGAGESLAVVWIDDEEVGLP
jgi:anti-sigma factor RsiW